MRLSFLYNGNPYTGKTFLYLEGPQLYSGKLDPYYTRNIWPHQQTVSKTYVKGLACPYPLTQSSHPSLGYCTKQSSHSVVLCTKFQKDLLTKVDVIGTIDLLFKCHNAPVPYPTVQHLVTTMCAHSCYKVMHCWDICPLHYGICKILIVIFSRWEQ